MLHRAEILWACAHSPSLDQLNDIILKDANISLLKDVDPELFNSLINTGSDLGELFKLAEQLKELATKYYYIVLPIGSPAFMWAFTQVTSLQWGPGEPIQLGAFDFTPLFAHSKRVSKEEVIDGEVKKTSIFKHLGFIKMDSRTYSPLDGGSDE